MTIRFLQTCDSGVPDFPFQAGQVIHVTDPSGFLLALCDGVRAEVVKDDATECAVAPVNERPEPTVKMSKRKRRAVIH